MTESRAISAYDQYCIDQYSSLIMDRKALPVSADNNDQFYKIEKRLINSPYAQNVWRFLFLALYKLLHRLNLAPGTEFIASYSVPQILAWGYILQQDGGAKDWCRHAYGKHKDAVFEEFKKDPKGIRNLSLSKRNLHVLTRSQWLAMGAVFNFLDIKTLHLCSNQLGEISNDSWQGLCAAIKSSKKIKTLFFSNNVMGKAPKEYWPTLLCGNSLKYIYLASNSLRDMSPDHWQVIRASLPQSSLNNLHIGGNYLAELDTVSRSILCDAFMNSKLTKVSFNSVSLERFSIAYIDMLGHALAGSMIVEFDAAGNDLRDFEADKYRAFWRMVNRSNLKSLNLAFNFTLTHPSKEFWQIMGEELQINKLKRIQFGESEFYAMPDDAWNEFCLVAHKLKFTNIDIFSCKIDETRKAQIERIVRQNVLRESVSMEEGGLKSLIFHSMFQQGASKLKTVFYNNRKNLPEELRARLKIGY